MSRMMVIVATALLWAVSAAAAAWAQAPAPSVHPGTKLSFGSTVGGAKLESSLHFAAVPGIRSAGDTYTYSVGKIQITVDVFDAGRRVGAGAVNPTVANQFDTEA